MNEREGYFRVSYRNPGHWDIYNCSERAFRIRGEPGAVHVYDERTDLNRPFPRVTRVFFTVDAAMTAICAELMYEERQP